MCANPSVQVSELKTVSVVQDEGAKLCAKLCAPEADARASGPAQPEPEEDVVIKKRKTRRGKPKRRNLNPYIKPSFQQRKNLNYRQPFNSRKYRSNKVSQALAPYNSNQFLMEDHGNVQQLDDKLNNPNVAGTSMPSRTRDSSFSVDSDADFYSSPEDEEEFLTKEFDIEYKDYNAERLQSMSKTELIGEYLMLENRVDTLTKKLVGKPAAALPDDATASADNLLQQQIHKLMLENDELRKENEHLRSGMCRSASCTSYSSSMDSESDSSSSCSSSASDNEMKEPAPLNNHTEMNGHADGHSPRSASPTPV